MSRRRSSPRTHVLSRVVSAATAAYGLVALAGPDHLPTALEVRGPQREGYRVVSQTYGVRDLAVSTLGIVGPPAGVRTAMALRILSDVTDGALLAARTDGAVRRKVLGFTLGWAALGATALVLDERRSRPAS